MSGAIDATFESVGSQTASFEFGTNREELDQNTTPPIETSGPANPPRTVTSMTPRYPRHRDKVIIACILLFMAALLGGGYLITRHVTRTFERIKENPVGFIGGLFKKLDTYDVCEAFLREHQDRYPQLGQHITYHVIKHEYRIHNKEKTARTVFRLQGNAGEKTLHFLLVRKNETWRITTVLLEGMDGRFDVLFPEEDSPTI